MCIIGAMSDDNDPPKRDKHIQAVVDRFFADSPAPRWPKEDKDKKRKHGKE